MSEVEQHSLNTYNIFLKKIIKVLGNITTTNHQLDPIGKSLFKSQWGGITMSDTFRKNSTKKYHIVNVDEHREPGSHWLAVYKSPTKIYVYDSLGRKSSKIIPNFVKRIGGQYIIDTDLDKEQDIYEKEKNCGQRCFAWLMVVKSLGIKKALLI